MPDITFAELQSARESMRADQRRGKHRRKRILTKPQDRFTREYIVWLDIWTQDPIGQIERHFSAPVVIPDKYLAVPEGMRWRMEIDFIGYVRELKIAEREWLLSVGHFMEKLFGEKGNLAFARGEHHPRALALAGPRPERWELVALAARGDPWCLGFTKTRTPAVEAIIGKEETRPAYRQAAIPSAELMLEPEVEALLRGRARIEGSFIDEADDEEARRNYEEAMARATEAEGEAEEDSDLTGDDLDAGEEGRGDVLDLDLTNGRRPDGLDTIGEGDLSGADLDDEELADLEVELPDFDPARAHGGHQKGGKGAKGSKTQLRSGAPPDAPRRTDGTFARRTS